MIFIIGLISILFIAAGFIVLHFALSHRTRELKMAGWTLVIGGVVSLFFAIYAPMQAPYDGAAIHRAFGGKPKLCDHHKQEQKMLLEAPPPPEAGKPKPANSGTGL